MPLQDFEGDILATVLISQGLIDPSGTNLAEAIQAVYDPNAAYYQNRYEIFAEWVLLPIGQALDPERFQTLDDIIDPETGEFLPEIREAFINDHSTNVQNFATGLLGLDFDTYVRAFRMPPQYSGADDESSYGFQIALMALAQFLENLQIALQQERSQ